MVPLTYRRSPPESMPADQTLGHAMTLSRAVAVLFSMHIDEGENGAVDLVIRRAIRADANEPPVFPQFFV